ncbi:CRISPR-associated protein Cas5d [[Clostridium] aminophilum]|uniref:pre-crRNA processing endonuclease n=1 Tax=[Clostridium] aminophilum TaxID=1526 RepID=A0A1I0A0P7_9FIRM|nr:type I-C CRISPR-associated protein Cas5c [[Clostridium] aminophilum]SES87238.1 CRISPR-associated protein Cas5d [[Clostridium] aminophilum]
MAVKVEIWGDYALFTRPEMKVERVSYDVITPSAARGILEAIYWHPGLMWVIDAIQVCNPIQFTNIRRNEVKSKISAKIVKTVMNSGKGKLYLDASNDIQQRASLLLKDVRYVIEAHFEMTDKAAKSDNPGKFQDIMKRRLQRGQYYHQPCMGCREFPAFFKEATGETIVSESLLGEKDLGFMLYDMDYSDVEDIKPMYFRAKMVNGMIRIPQKDSEEVLR